MNLVFLMRAELIYYLLLSKKQILLSKVRKASIPRLSRNEIENLPIQIPPLELQKEIVRVLDDYTEYKELLEKELIDELTTRQKQYDYFRDKLLTFKEQK